jgi:chromosome segregation ATPase
MLTDKLRMQGQITQQYERALNQATATLQKNAQKQQDLSSKLTTAKTRYATLKPQIDKTKAAYDASVKATGDNSEESNRLGLELLELEEQYKATGDEIKTLEGQIEANSKTLQRNADTVTKLQTSLNKAKSAEAATASELSKTNKAIETNKAKWDAAAKSLDTFGNSATNAGKSISKVGGKLTTYVTAPLLALGALATKGATEFETAFAGVRKTVDATEAEFAALDEALQNMTLVKPASYVDVAGLAEMAGQLGVATETLKRLSPSWSTWGNRQTSPARKAQSSLQNSQTSSA